MNVPVTESISEAFWKTANRCETDIIPLGFVSLKSTGQQ